MTGCLTSADVSTDAYVNLGPAYVKCQILNCKKIKYMAINLFLGNNCAGDFSTCKGCESGFTLQGNLCIQDQVKEEEPPLNNSTKFGKI